MLIKRWGEYAEPTKSQIALAIEIIEYGPSEAHLDYNYYQSIIDLLLSGF